MDDLIVNNFTVLDSVYGKFIVNRHCDFQADALVKTGRPHIDDELKKVLAIVRTLPQGCVIIDAGANIGLLSIPIARAVQANGGTVLAFEAQRMLFYALCGATSLNDLQNLHPYNRALGAETKTVRVPRLDYGAKQDFGLLSLVDPVADPKSEAVPMQPIDALGLSRLDFLKIDVEGMEIEVLQGAQRLIREHRPWCWVEYWKVSADRIKSQFANLSYTFHVMDNLNLLCAPAERLAASGLTIKAPQA
jgi:FkbM family methyltransferase